MNTTQPGVVVAGWTACAVAIATACVACGGDDRLPDVDLPGAQDTPVEETDIPKDDGSNDDMADTRDVLEDGGAGDVADTAGIDGDGGANPDVTADAWLDDAAVDPGVDIPNEDIQDDDTPDDVPSVADTPVADTPDVPPEVIACEPVAESCNGLDDDCDDGIDELDDPPGHRLVLNCYPDATRTQRMPVADCWDWLTRDELAVGASVFVAIEFVKTSSPCDAASGIQTCLSSAITTCTGQTLQGACLDTLFFQGRFIGTQNFFQSGDGRFEFRVDRTTNPMVAAIQASDVALEGCTYLFNTFSCAPACRP